MCVGGGGVGLDLVWPGVFRSSLETPTYFSGHFFEVIPFFTIFTMQTPENFGNFKNTDLCLDFFFF